MTRVLVGPVPNIRPGKAVVFLRPEALELLADAVEIYGAPIYPTGSGSAGRTYEQQLHYWNVFQNGGPIASHPDHGPNPHRRYGAIDIDNYRARAAMLKAGWLATTPSEWWHFEHPDCRSWPIVSDPYTEEENEMKQGSLWLKSSRTGHWYEIGEFTHRRITEHAEASLVSAAYGRNALEVAPNVITAAIRRAEENKATLPGGSGASPAQIAAAVRAELGDDFDEVLDAVNAPRTLS